MSTRSKEEKDNLFVQHMGIFSSWPCGCFPETEPCPCRENNCGCPITVRICDHAEDWNLDEQERLIDEMGRFLLAVDPDNYAERPTAPRPIRCLTQSKRLTLMQQRVDKGYSPFSPHDTYRRVLNIVAGEVVRRGRNGLVTQSGSIREDTNEEKR